MTYFNLRKREAEAEPEDVEEEVEDTEEEPPTGWVGAIWCGITGPWHWLVAHLGRYGVGTAWGVYGGSVWAFFYYGGAVAAGLTLVWPLLVLLFIPREFKDRATAAIERLFTPAPKPDAGAAPGGEREAVRRLLLDVIGDAHGVHLKTVLAHLQAHGQWEGRKVADLRVHLEALGIPVDPKLKVAGVPTRGVLRTALEALPPVEETPHSPTSSPPV